MRIIHNLSKEAREKIIEVLLEKRSNKELAEDLGISPSSVTKFLNGMTHPSDVTIERALEIADDEEREKIYEIIVEDVVDSLIEFLSEIDTENEKILRLRECLVK